ncbi:mitochondrial protein required for respiration [Mycena floridula]|nr:mitochondrial protein required for respiration [Mycena floridula]
MLRFLNLLKRSLRREKASVPVIYKQRKDPWVTPTLVLVGIIPFFTFGLGCWQLQRLKWKINLIDELEEKLELPALPLPKRINLDVIPEFAFRKVVLHGVWDHVHSMLVSPRVHEGVHGAHVVTPLLRQDGTTVLVDRGFVSNEKLTSYHREKGEVEVFGLLRTAPGHNTFTPTNRPSTGDWYWIDIDAMVEFAGGEKANVQPVFVEQIFDGHAGEAALRIEAGVPVGRPASVDLRNAHLSYVVTWFGLSAVTTFMFARLLLDKRKRLGRRMPRQ